MEAPQPTPGTMLPWIADDEAEGMYFEVCDEKGDWDIALFSFGDPVSEPYLPTHAQAKANAAYTVHACNAYPGLAGRCEALTAEVAALREELESQADGCSMIISMFKTMPGAVAASLIGMLSIQEQAARALLERPVS